MLISLTHPNNTPVLVNTAHVVSVSKVEKDDDTFSEIIMTHGPSIITTEEPDEILEIIAQA